ncbi:hypothetical protein BDAP_000915 [Binucleata daphniae]
MIKNDKLQILKETDTANIWTDFTVDNIQVIETILQRLKIARDNMPKDKNEGYRRNIKFDESEHIKSDMNIVKQVNKDVYNVVNDLPYFVAKETNDEEDEFLLPQTKDKTYMCGNDLSWYTETSNKKRNENQNKNKYAKSCIPITKYNCVTNKNDVTYNFANYNKFVESITSTNFRLCVEESIYFRKTKPTNKTYMFCALRKKGKKMLQNTTKNKLKLQAIKLEYKKMTLTEKNEIKNKDLYTRKNSYGDKTSKEKIRDTRNDTKEDIEEIYETFGIKKNVDLSKYGIFAKEEETKK